MPRLFALVSVCLLVIAAPLHAQEGPADLPPKAPDAASPPTTDEGQNPTPGLDFASLPAPIRLGVRVNLLRKNIPVYAAVVVVPNVNAYTEAIANWSTEGRYPVLIDDGTDAAAENIARFVRAYRPDAVLRWEGTGRAWPRSLEAMQEAVSDAAAQAFDAENNGALPARWAELQFSPMGVVVTSIKDPAWPGALAMAAGYSQPIAWIDAEPGSLAGEAGPETIETLDGAVKALCESLSLSFAAFGDAVDAYTVCLNMPTKLAGADGPLALTDSLGRTDGKARWAMVGMMPGDEQASAYRAMCSLFLNPRTGWLVDGYETRSDTKTYQVTRPAAMLRERGVQSVADRPPSVGLSAWRGRAAQGVDAGFIHINSSGQRRWFKLADDTVDAADIPLLRTPAIVHMIHSFSAQNPDDPQSIAGRWLERGAYLYFGSVDEPYLRSFQTPENMARRWVSKAPFSVAVRIDGLEPWKLNYFGDPLLMLADEAKQKPGMPALEGAQAMSDLVREAIRARDLPGAARLLVMLGRDEDAARLFSAALADKDHEVSPELAEVCFYPLIRAGDIVGAIKAFERMPEKAQKNDPRVDALWLAARPRLSLMPPDAHAAQVLKAHVRQRCAVDDVETLLPALRRTTDAATLRAWIQGVAEEVKNEKETQRLLDLAARY